MALPVLCVASISRETKKSGGAVHADVNESGCGHVMESNDIFSSDRPWYNIKKYQRILLASEWFSSKKLPKFREPVESR
jgi:hypothetical protein